MEHIIIQKVDAAERGLATADPDRGKRQSSDPARAASIFGADPTELG